MLHIAFSVMHGHIHVSINIPVYAILTGSLNILFKALSFILSTSFISSFFMYPYASIPYISAGIKKASKSFNYTLISSLLSLLPYLLPHTSVLIPKCALLDSPLHLF